MSDGEEGIPIKHPKPASSAQDPNEAPASGEIGRNIFDGRESALKSKGASRSSTGVLVGIGTESHKPSSSSGNGPYLSSESGVDGSSDESAVGKKRNGHQMLEDASAQDNEAMNPENPVDTIPATNLYIGIDYWNAPPVGAASAIAQSNPLESVAPDQWDERELKRQKRKQSNRESARRSRLRKQADYDELQGRVDTLKNENHLLKKELQIFSQECENVASENQSIKEELLRICSPADLSRLEIILQEAEGSS